MTLRELLNQVTNNQMDLSEPFIELDYDVVIGIKGEAAWTGETKVFTDDISIVFPSDLVNRIYIKISRETLEMLLDKTK